jgi:hypothetical protein
MKHIKRFTRFDLTKESVDWNSEQFINDVEDRLVDFKHLGFGVVISQSSSTILDFDKKMQDVRYTDEPNKFHIRSAEIDRYSSGISNISLTIGLLLKDISGTYNSNFNIDELETIYNDFASYLKEAFGLVPNYINIVKLEIKTTAVGTLYGQFLYFKDFESIRQFLISKNSADIDNIKITGINLGFRK